MASRGTVESFVLRVAGRLSDDCVIVVPLPWTSPPPPPGILTPVRHPQSGLTFDDAEFARMDSKIPRTVLVPCTFDTVAEEAAVRQIMPRLTADESGSVCVFMLLLFGQELVINTEEASRVAVERHNRMFDLHADDVIANPEPDPSVLQRSIDLTRMKRGYNIQRVQDFLSFEPLPVDPDHLAQVQARHRKLLWESSPRMMCRHFPPIDRTIRETEQAVGDYQLLEEAFETSTCAIVCAESERHGRCAVKIIEKPQVHQLARVEEIYRAFLFTSEKLRHPNIVRCLQMIHTESRLYMVLEHAGSHNLKQLLASRPGQRLEGAGRDACFEQLTGALAHCHRLAISHRNVTLEHIVVMETPEAPQLHCRLTGFMSAIQAHPVDSLCFIQCGTIPFAAPEAFMGGAYLARLVDSWSAGVALIEVAGGLSSTERSVGYAEAEPLEAALEMQRFFDMEGSHRRALSCVCGADPDPHVLKLAEMLVNPRVEERSEMQSVEALLASWKSTGAFQPP